MRGIGLSRSEASSGTTEIHYIQELIRHAPLSSPSEGSSASGRQKMHLFHCSGTPTRAISGVFPSNLPVASSRLHVGVKLCADYLASYALLASEERAVDKTAAAVEPEVSLGRNETG